MLIHGTLGPLSKGKNGNWTAILQSASSVNVTAFVIFEGMCIVVKIGIAKSKS